jgi:hypothetical protein
VGELIAASKVRVNVDDPPEGGGGIVILGLDTGMVGLPGAFINDVVKFDMINSLPWFVGLTAPSAKSKDRANPERAWKAC